MDKLLDNSINIERFAAFLDGNLPEADMHEVDLMLSSNPVMEELLTVSNIIDEEMYVTSQDVYANDAEMQMIEEMDFDIPILENISPFSSGEDPSLDKNDDFFEAEVIENKETQTLYNQVRQEQTDEFNKHDINLITMKTNQVNNDLVGAQAARAIYGEGEMGIQDAMIYQGEEGICAIRSQQIILRDYGIDIPIEDLKQFAIQNGWYDPSEDGGTPMWAIGALLESCNVDCRQETNCTIYDIVNELSQGHRVIVGVDANELWATRNGDVAGQAEEWFNDYFKGDTPNHALIVAGVEVNPNDPEDVKVILTDPGTGDLRIEYDLEDFMDAWEDSQCFMTTTTTPAPLQYDPEKGCQVPSNFAVEEYINTNSLPLNPNNVILPGEMAAMCADPYYSEGHLNTIPVDGHDIAYENYAQALADAQRYKSAVGGGVNSFGLDHFDSDIFISSLKGLLGIGDDSDDVFNEELQKSSLNSELDEDDFEQDDESGFAGYDDDDEFDSDDDDNLDNDDADGECLEMFNSL